MKALPCDRFERPCNLIGMSVAIDVSMNGSFGVNLSTPMSITQIIPPCK